jgi:hypothetical protein
MKYMLLIYSAESDWTDEERAACMVESMGVGAELATRGIYIMSSPLEFVTAATSVRVRNGQTQITTGPFAETSEQLGGFYILELDNLDEAIAVASRLPPAKKGTVEIRPVLALDGLPPDAFELVDVHDPSLTPYMLLCYDDAEHWKQVGPEAQHAAMMEAVAATRELAARGRYISASPLHPVETATSLRIRNGRRTISDGPFAETREVLGGFYLLLAKDRHEVEAIAARHTGAPTGTVEIRPLFDLSGVRNSVANQTARVNGGNV